MSNFNLADYIKPPEGAAKPAERRLQMIPTRKIFANDKNFYDTSKVDDLIDSILMQGLLDPLTVRPSGDGEGYIIISGHRRHRALMTILDDHLAEDTKPFETTPCFVREPGDDLMEELMLIQANSATRVLTSAETSKQVDRVRDLLVNTDFLLPRSRVNEMVHNFIDPGLEDLCVSRTSFKWGIPVDFDPKHVVYVWIDALFNYTTALGFMNDKYPDSDYETFWPADVHFIGKEIVRFHSIIWPAMLMSMDMPLPKHVYGHGWLLLDGGKMSKSKGNVVDPYLLAERYSADALRYFLLRDFPFGSDGNFSNELLINRINMDLANDLGNLLSRTTAMADKYFGGCLPIEQDEGAEDAALLEKVSGLRARYEADMEAYAFQNALADVFEVIDNANKYIDATAPWVLAKSEDTKPRLARVLYNLAETLRICTVLLQPFMPATCEKIFAQLGVDDSLKTWDSAAAVGSMPANATLHKGENIFPRIDTAKELAELDALEAAQKAAAQAANAPAEEPKAEAAAASAELIGDHEEEISFDDFCKVELRVAEVRACERMKESKKLLHLTVFDGERERCILSGIAKWFAPEDLIGKKIGIVANLAPRPMMKGKYVSEGMIFAADTDVDGGCSIAFFPDSTPAGARIH